MTATAKPKRRSLDWPRRVYHRSALIRRSVMALCEKTALDKKTESLTLIDESTTCPACIAIIAKRTAS